jgi:PAS domain S-box-containing protein
MTPETQIAEARRTISELETQLEDARQAASRLSAIVEWSDDAMFSMSPETIIQTWNPGAERLLGYSREEITGHPASLLVSPSMAEHLSRFLELTAAGEISPVHEVRCLRKDGSPVHVAFTCSAMRDADGTMTGFSVVLRDITARLAAEAALADARAEREVRAERDRMARDLHDRVIQRIFAAGMALQTAASMSRSPGATARIEAVVRDLDATIDELRETIFALRRHPREDAGLRYRLMSITEEITPVLGFSPEVTLQGPVDQVTEGLARQVLSVCREALSNIARHTAASEVAITLSVNDDLLLRVTDNGHGADAPSWTVGLGNMRHRAEMPGGTFDVCNRPGGGTEIEWRVPL